MDNIIFVSSLKEDINQAIQGIENSVFDIEYKVDIYYYLCATIDRLEGGRIDLFQPQIIQDVINQVNLSSNTTTIHMP